MIKRYEAVLGPNTHQWWVYDNEDGVLIDPPAAVLDEIAQEASTEQQQERLEAICAENPTWLEDAAYRFDDSSIEI